MAWWISTLFLAALVMGTAANSRMRGSLLKDEALFEEGVDAATVRASLQLALDAASHVNEESKRFSSINATMWPTYLSMPKVHGGRLSPMAVRHVVQSYFAQVHGWKLLDFDNSSAPKGSVLPANAAAIIEAILEAHEHGQGLIISEVVAMAAALERLILDDSVLMLRKAYEINDISPQDQVDMEEISEILLSYLALYQHQSDTDMMTVSIKPENHQRWKRKMINKGLYEWEKDFVEQALLDFYYQHKDAIGTFREPQFVFEDVAEIVDAMAHKFGRVHDEECTNLRESLEEDDPAGTGRVALEDFYKARPDIRRFLLEETIEDLRDMGAIDSSVPGKPQVRIMNYVLSTANCLKRSKFYYVCCISPCNAIMSQIEHTFMSPKVSPNQLWGLLSNISTEVDKDLDIHGSPLHGPTGAHLHLSLSSIATKHGGFVPIYSNSFSNWLHFAFPRECPLHQALATTQLQPNISTELSQAPAEWISDMELHMPSGDLSWVSEDVMIPRQLRMDASDEASRWLTWFLRILAVVGICFSWTLLGQKMIRNTLACFMIGSGRVKKNEDYYLPLRF